MLLPRQSETDQAYRQRGNLRRCRWNRCRRSRTDGNQQNHARIPEENRGEFGVQGIEPQGHDGIAQDEREYGAVNQRKGRSLPQHGAECKRNHDQRQRLACTDDAQVDRFALGQGRGDRRHEKELTAPVAFVGTALAAHIARDRRFRVRLQPRCRRQVGPQADARRDPPHVELIGVAQKRSGAHDCIHSPRTDADQNEREQSCESCPLRHDGTGSMQSADDRSCRKRVAAQAARRLE